MKESAQYVKMGATIRTAHIPICAVLNTAAVFSNNMDIEATIKGRTFKVIESPNGCDDCDLRADCDLDYLIFNECSNHLAVQAALKEVKPGRWPFDKCKICKMSKDFIGCEGDIHYKQCVENDGILFSPLVQNFKRQKKRD